MRWVCVRCELLLNLFYLTGFGEGLDGDALSLYPEPFCDSLWQLHIWLCSEVQTIIDPVKLIFVQ
jgi:hypothetical protein